MALTGFIRLRNQFQLLQVVFWQKCLHATDLSPGFCEGLREIVKGKKWENVLSQFCFASDMFVGWAFSIETVFSSVGLVLTTA